MPITANVQWFEGAATVVVYSKDWSTKRKLVARSAAELWSILERMPELLPPPAETVEEFLTRGGKIQKVGTKPVKLQELCDILGI